MTERPSRLSFLGCWADSYTVGSFLEHLQDQIEAKQRHLVVNHNVNSLALCQRNESFRSFQNQGDTCVFDGMGAILLAKLTGHHVTSANRVAVLDYIWQLLELAQRNDWNIVHVGSTDQVMTEARLHIEGKIGDVSLTMLSGFFDRAPGSSGNAAMLSDIREAKPDVLLIGMGMPIQEEWLLANYDELPECPILTVGGLLGYLGGDRATPPRWMGPLMLEWLYRLATERQRLWKRYLIEPFVLLRPVTLEIFRNLRARSLSR
jgi:N-acetylglucosaminyldiphosphoundecaprenol N-acetyl-beta-D-mannosaminyltransferase